MMTLLPNGIGEPLGDQLVLAKPLWSTGRVWYVDSATGNDAVGTLGLARERPLATLGQAVSNASAGDIIVLLATHNETLTGTLNISKRLSIIGAGSSAGQPTARLRINHSNAPLLFINADDVELRNILFPPNVQANVASRIKVQNKGFRMYGCRLECGATDLLTALEISVNAYQARLRSNVFVSVATSATAVPGSGLLMLPTTQAGLEMEDCVFDNGPHGFEAGSGHYAAYLAGKRLRVQGLSLLRGADVFVNPASTGWINAQETTGGAVIDWLYDESGDTVDYCDLTAL